MLGNFFSVNLFLITHLIYGICHPHYEMASIELLFLIVVRWIMFYTFWHQWKRFFCCEQYRKRVSDGHKTNSLHCRLIKYTPGSPKFLFYLTHLLISWEKKNQRNMHLFNKEHKWGELMGKTKKRPSPLSTFLKDIYLTAQLFLYTSFFTSSITDSAATRLHSQVFLWHF